MPCPPDAISLPRRLRSPAFRLPAADDVIKIPDFPRSPAERRVLQSWRPHCADASLFILPVSACAVQQPQATHPATTSASGLAALAPYKPYARPCRDSACCDVILPVPLSLGTPERMQQ